MLLCLSLAALAGNGGEIGVQGDVAAEPSSTRPSFSLGSGKKKARAADPVMLVPVGYMSDKINWWGRYYDEDGTVYRAGEVVQVLKGADCSRDEIRRYERSNIGASICYTGALILLPTAVGWVPCYLGGLGFSYMANSHLEDALYEYNKLNAWEEEE